MPPLLRAVRRHLGVSVPLAVIYAGVVLLAARGRVDGVTLGAIALVGVVTLLTPAAVTRLNRGVLRGSWTPALAPGERVLHDGAADRYDAGHSGWLFLTDRRLLLYRVDGSEEWSAALDDVAEARVGRLAGVFATDLVVELRGAGARRLWVEGAGEWVERIRAARALPARPVGGRVG